MTGYGCDLVSGYCGGGFGGDPTNGYSWAVTNVPNFSGLDFGFGPGGGNVVGGLINQGISTGIGILGNAIQGSGQRNQRNDQIEQAWERLIQEALARYRRIAALAVTSANDIAEAQGVLDGLDQFVSQYGNDYISQQWNSSAYRPAFASQLASFQARLGNGAGSQGQRTGGAGLFDGAAVGGIDITWILIALVAVLALKN